MAQLMTDEQRLKALEAYDPREHLIAVGKNKDNSPVLYYPAAWRLYELRLRHPHFTLEAEIIHMDEEKGTVIIKAIGYDGLDYASSNLKGTALKQGKLFELDKVETKAKSRVARDIGIGTEYALDMDADETDAVHPQADKSKQNGNRQPPQSKPSNVVPMPQKPSQPAITQAQLNALYDTGKASGQWQSFNGMCAFACAELGFNIGAKEDFLKLSTEQYQQLVAATAQETAGAGAGR